MACTLQITQLFVGCCICHKGMHSTITHCFEIVIRTADVASSMPSLLWRLLVSAKSMLVIEVSALWCCRQHVVV